jgi:NAD(P)-dependent dehydrogenase (short-subunit alcohol dehydrogenase family)
MALSLLMRPDRTRHPYTATKHGITGLTKSLMLDGLAFNIACGQIDIGNTTTDMSAGMATGAMQANGTTMVEPRIRAKLVAEAVVHLANPPLEANIPFATIMASGMPLYDRGKAGVISLPSIQGRIVVLARPRLLRKDFIARGKRSR